jgi:hypothetical protein
MLGIAQSSLHIPVQFAFLMLTSIGVVFAIMYNSATPDFYENNAHHKIGWVIVWMLVAQGASGMISGVSRYVISGDLRSRDFTEDTEEMFMLGNDEDDDEGNKSVGRPSSDSGNITGESTPRESSPSAIHRSSDNTLRDDHERQFHTVDLTNPPRNAEFKTEMYIAKKLNRGWLSRVSQRGVLIAKFVHAIIGRPMFVLGFIQICTGIVTVTGIFKANDVFNGLAHFIKGIFSEFICQ